MANLYNSSLIASRRPKKSAFTKTAIVMAAMLTLGAASEKANAEYIQVGISANDLTGGQLGCENPLGTYSEIQTSDNPLATNGYDIGLDHTINETFDNIPGGVDDTHVFSIYSPLGENQAITNVSNNYIQNFQDGETHTMHLSLRDDVGLGAYINMNIDLLGFNVNAGTDSSYNFSIDTDGNGTLETSVTGMLSDISESGNIWNGNVYVPSGLDIRNTNTSTGYSHHFGKIDFNITSVPEPSILALLAGAGLTGAGLATSRRKKRQ